MDGPTPQFICESCKKLGPLSALQRDRWGDPCCPDCGSAHIKRHRTRLRAALEAYFLFNVF